MMAAEQKRKPRFRPVMLLGILVGVLIGCWTSLELKASTTERVVTDYHTGLAISGFDPVAYFTSSKAIAGRADFETRYLRSDVAFHQ